MYYSSHFEKAFQKLPVAVRKQAIAKEKIFKKDSFDTRLKTHKLKGNLNEYWAFSINYSYRILFTLSPINNDV
ncbi:type II toxin-antitoxin system mRNA interferase toxin, RelE/StbE family [Candidatus Peregrinibacteria bacterium]|nr:type II toxin-antitoxin system mRNA interferase toxin, RelE/StbE family [Candidatus Peregrinibacteria bacterium]